MLPKGCPGVQPVKVAGESALDVVRVGIGRALARQHRGAVERHLVLHRLLAGSQVGQHQLEQTTHVAAAARDERLRHERRLALAERIDDGHGSGLTRTDGILLRLVASGLAQTQRLLGLALGGTDGLDLGGLALAGQLEHLAVTIRLGDVRLGVGLVDLDRDLSGSQLLLHVGLAGLRLEGHTGLLGLLLVSEGGLLLLGDLSLGQDLDQLRGQYDVLDVDTAHLHVVPGQVLRDVLGGLLLDRAARLDEVGCRHLAELVAEVVAHRRLEHLVDEVLHGAHRADDPRRLGVGDVDLDLQVDRELERILRLGPDRNQPLVELVCLAVLVGPVELQDGRRHLDGRVDVRVHRVLARAERLIPDALVTGADDAAELVGLAAAVHGRQTDERLDDANLALLDDEHGRRLDADQERVQHVDTRHQHVVLHAQTAALVEELLEVLVVRVQPVLARQHGIDHSRRGRSRLLEGFDVTEATDAPGDVAALERRTVECGDDADHVRTDRHEAQVEGLDLSNQGLSLVVDGVAVDVTLGHDQEGVRMDGTGSARGQDATLHTLLAAVRHEGADIHEVTERVGVARRLGTGGQRISHLGDDDADGAGRDLDERLDLHGVDRPQLEPPPVLDGVRLVAGLAVEGQEAAVGDLLAEVLRHPAVVAGRDVLDRLEQDEQHDQRDDADDDEHR